MFSLIGKFINNIKDTAAENRMKKEAESLCYRLFIDETKKLITKQGKYPEAELYRFAWKRSIVLKSLFKDSDSASKYDSIQKMALSDYFKVAPSNPYRSKGIELSQKAYDKLLASEKKILYPELAQEPKEKKASVSKPKKTITKNPRYGHTGRTVSNYKYKSDGTAIDDFVNELSSFTKSAESVAYSVSGLTGKPRRHKTTGVKSNHSTEMDNINSWKKTYKVGLLVPRSFHDLGSLVDNLLKGIKQADYDDDYVKHVIYPLSNKAEAIFRGFITKYDLESVVTAGIKSDGRISIWITIALPVTAREIVVHCGTYLTDYPKKFQDEMTELVNNHLQKKPELFSEIYEDYDARYKILRNIEQKLRKLHGVPLIGEGFVNQTALFNIVKKKFPRALSEHSPTWLGKQRFDIYIPEKRLAIEYNGQQHYSPVDIFGGEEGFERTCMRDEQKRNVSEANNVKVYDWHHERKICDKEIDALYFWIDHNCN